MSRFFKSAAFPILIVIVLAFFASKLISDSDQPNKPNFQQFLTQVDQGKVQSVVMRTKDNSLEVTLDGGAKYQTGYPMNYEPILTTKLLKDADTGALQSFDVKPAHSSVILSLLTYVLPFVLFFGLWIFLMNQVQGGGSKVMSFGKSRAKRLSVDSPKITFRDVAGVDEAVEELHEIKEFLENPKKFQVLGARIPKGVLLYGPPGTGKTLLARAVAGEAGVPFFSISGSDFVEMFVGVGASRVRDLFRQAKENSPCIIFLDEIDAVGRRRGTGLGGGHDEREQTLNQILVEMDGFDTDEGIIVMAATNRQDVLDPALMRPGRFDRQVMVDLPDVKGREEILKIHAKKVKLGRDVDLKRIARATPMFSGADLASLINEAAIMATMHKKDAVELADLEEARDKVLWGRQKKSRVVVEEEKRITAYHEAGHTLVGVLTPESDPIHKATIIPRGRALGATFTLPENDKYGRGRRE